MPDPLDLVSCKAAVITAPLLKCAACGHRLYFGKASRNKKSSGARKALSAGSRKRAELWRVKGVVLKKTHNLRSKCHQKDPCQLRIKRNQMSWTHVQMPEFLHKRSNSNEERHSNSGKNSNNKNNDEDNHTMDQYKSTNSMKHRSNISLD